MVVIDNLNVKYNGKTALNIKSQIKFEDGDRIGIIGSNGAGKSTLVKAILGIVKYDGRIVTDIKPEQIAVHMQENNYVDTMSIKNIMEGLLCTKVKDNKRLRELIDFFDFEPCLKKRFKNLSGGQKQRMTIIMVLMQDSPLVFFDEVTSGLDFETRQQLMTKITKWYENKKTTICIVSHYYEELDNIVKKILIIEKGQLVDYGDKDELFKKYCGHSVIVLDNTEKNRKLTMNFTKLVSPEHLIAVSCRDKEEQMDVTRVLIDNDVNFKRSNNDIEIMEINAKAVFNGEYEGGEDNEYKAI
ncbi:MAG: ABC transporter ATP-binding protein [Inconstantimicrobium porci]|uniref:ABC transporter ATP-binding protein n=1 Tax=Inconstantimicrobium porci TaxID=2652291 RepID=UPI002A90F9B4|nr:ABC transporter ATP-binding protein [Inconstantimicrobium porci]MDY5912055.1 ABC transporter ATP-binding protein [Inconstantimicrobium porci]